MITVPGWYGRLLCTAPWCRFLWRGNFSFALPRHYKTLNVADEADSVKVLGRADSADAVDAQMSAYWTEGMRPFSGHKFPIVSGKVMGQQALFAPSLPGIL